MEILKKILRFWFPFFAVVSVITYLQSPSDYKELVKYSCCFIPEGKLRKMLCIKNIRAEGRFLTHSILLLCCSKMRHCSCCKVCI